MPKGRGRGRGRTFTSPEELEEQRQKEQRKKEWRAQHGGDSESGSDEEGAEGKSSEESSESEEEEGKEEKNKGVSGLIEIENPNRAQQKFKKVSTLDNATGDKAEAPVGKPALSRREREELEKQRAKAHYQKLHAQGKTEEARNDLARLAIIRKQREDAAKKKEEERKAREAKEAAAAKEKS